MHKHTTSLKHKNILQVQYIKIKCRYIKMHKYTASSKYTNTIVIDFGKQRLLSSDQRNSQKLTLQTN